MKNIIKISQNKKNDFIIEKSDKWRNSIIIKFEINEEIDYINLFLILKSYCLNQKYPVFSVSSLLIDEDLNKYIICQNETRSFINKIDYFKFMEWVNFRISEDERYKKKKNFAGFLLLFNNSIMDIANKNKKYDILNYLKPQFPWNLEWLNIFKKDMNTIEFQEKKIEFLINEIEKIKKK